MKRVLAISFGSRHTSAVLMESTSVGLAVTGFAILEAPRTDSPGQPISAEKYAEHFRNLRQAMGGKIREAVVVLNHRDSLLRLTELPVMPVAGLRELLARNPRLHLQQDFPGHVFDCHVQQLQPHHHEQKPGEAGKPSGPPPAPRGRKLSTLVGGARRDFLELLAKAGRMAGLRIEQAIPAQMAQIQALKTPLTTSQLEAAVASIDIGLDQSSICIMAGGELAHSRVVPVGGNSLTQGLAEAMKVTHDAAESVKVLLPNTVDLKLQALLAPLAQELKESIDFFEVQYEKKVSLVFVSGGTARSPLIVEMLEKQVQTPCKVWHLAETVSVNLTDDQAALFKRDLPQLMAPVGAAMEALGAIPAGLNLLATSIEEERKRRRSPVRMGAAAAVFLVCLLLTWSAVLGWRLNAESAALSASEELAVSKRAREATAFLTETSHNERRLRDLAEQATNRFLAAPILDALQRCMVDDIVVTKLILDRTRMEIARNPNERPRERETVRVSIQAKDYSDLSATDRLIDTIASNPYFKKRLPGANAVILKQRSSRQADTANPALSFALVTIECTLIE